MLRSNSSQEHRNFLTIESAAKKLLFLSLSVVILEIAIDFAVYFNASDRQITEMELLPGGGLNFSRQYEQYASIN